MKKVLIIAAAVVVLAIIVLLVRKPSGNVATQTQSQQSTDSLTTNTTGEVPAATTSAKPATDTAAPAAKPPVKLAYAEAVKRYGAQRIQFNAQCQATPTSSTFKSGLEIMLDNRADVERSIVFSGKAYKIPAYDYAVVTLTTHGIIYIDCGTSQNVAKLTVQ